MKSKFLALLSGEGTTIPEAEARALFLTYDPSSTFESPEPRVLVALSGADPSLVASRIAFSRRVGLLISKASDAARTVKGKRVRFRSFSLGPTEPVDPGKVLEDLDAEVDLEHPDFEFTLVQGKRTYLALTTPEKMNQGWSLRRPRRRAYFHPSAIFPKLSRAIVNLSRVKEGQVFLDPFAGTGSIPIEAAEVGARAVAVDISREMNTGALANMKKFGQRWLGVVRADSQSSPLTLVDAIATDVPYGRASSTGGKEPHVVLQDALETLPRLLRPGSRMVIMHAKRSPMELGSAWALEEEHHLYVHKMLTRTITVLRRR